MSQVPSAARHAVQVPHAWLSSSSAGEIAGCCWSRRELSLTWNGKMAMATTLLRWLHPRSKDQLESCPPPLIPPSPGLGRRGIGSVDPITDACLRGVSRLGARTGGASSSTVHATAHVRAQAHAHVHAQAFDPGTNWEPSGRVLFAGDPTFSRPVQLGHPGASCQAGSGRRGEWHGWWEGAQA